MSNFNPMLTNCLHLTPSAGGLVADHFKNGLELQRLTKCDVRIGPLNGYTTTITERDSLATLMTSYNKNVGSSE